MLVRRLTPWLIAMIFIAGLSSPISARADTVATGAIAGVVSYPSGTTIVRATVTVYDSATGAQVGQASIGSTGSYSVAGLADGDYRMLFHPIDGALLDQWWLGATSWNDSAPVSITDGQSVSGLNLTFALGASISGHVYFDPVAAGPGAGSVGIAAYPVGVTSWSKVVSVSSGAAFTISGLPAGDYEVRAVGSADVLTQWWGGTSDRTTATAVTVAQSESRTGVDFTMQMMGHLAGAVSLPSGIALGDVSLRLTATPVDTQSASTAVWVAADGSFDLAVRPGRYILNFWDLNSKVGREYVGASETADGATVFDVASASRVGLGNVQLHRLLPLPFPKITNASVPVVGGDMTVAFPIAGTVAEGAAVTYTWLADDQPFAVTTADTITLIRDQLGKYISVRATATKDGYATASSTSAKTYGRVALAGQPILTGAPVVNSTVTVDRGEWTPGTTFTYLWYSDDHILASSGSSLKITPDLASTTLEVVVSGSAPGYTSVDRWSDPVYVQPAPMVSATPTIVGTSVVNQVLTAMTGTWLARTTFTYQWLTNGAAIPGATSSSLTLADAQRGAKISVQVTGSKDGYTTVTTTSAETAAILGVLASPTPTVTGPPAYGATLTAKPGIWTSGTRVTYQWYANNAAISGATASTLKIGAAQRDKSITVKATGTKSGYVTAVKVSTPTLRVITAGTPSISGTMKAGHTLTVVRGTWTSGVAFTYQWYANGKAIAGATKVMLRIPSSLRGKTLTVKVTGKKSGYPTVAKVSVARRVA